MNKNVRYLLIYMQPSVYALLNLGSLQRGRGYHGRKKELQTAPKSCTAGRRALCLASLLDGVRPRQVDDGNSHEEV